MEFKIHQCLRDGNAEKYVLEINNGVIIELGAIYHNDHLHLCVPTQIGCPVHCLHCATTYARHPFQGNLDVHILDSLIDYFINVYPKNNIILSFSGHGEPLLNWECIDFLSDKYRNRVRKVFVTTVGIKNTLQKILKDQKNYITFYLSLHAPNDVMRKKIIPIKDEMAKINDIINFTECYTINGGTIVWNYMLHKGNSSIKDIKELKSIINNLNASIKLRFTRYMPINIYNKIIPVYYISDERFDEISSNIIKEFRDLGNVKLSFSNIEGEKIQVACGQMRADNLNLR